MEKVIMDEEVQRIIKKSNNFTKPISYKDFISEMANYFKIKRKGIELMCITNDGEYISINDQNDLDEHIEEVKEFQVFSGFEDTNKEEKKEKTTPEQTNGSESNENKKEKAKKRSENGDEDKVNPYKINLEIIFNIKDEEIEEKICGGGGAIFIDENLNDINDIIEFNKDKYKQNLNNKNEIFIQNFKSKFDLNIKNIFDKKIFY